mmetsp:Transcript_176/g.261  ORF Transcript_176/g.261 Transcript_176/m.261 type:complete len:141 (-) Transcript_176:355-777(-)
MEDFLEFNNNADRQARDQTFYDHNDWRQTSIPGRVVSKLREFGQTPFIRALVLSFSDQKHGRSSPARALTFLVMVTSICAVIVTALLVGQIIQMIIGKEIVVDEEITVIEKVKETEFNRFKKRIAKEKDRSRKSEKEKSS